MVNADTEHVLNSRHIPSVATTLLPAVESWLLIAWCNILQCQTAVSSSRTVFLNHSLRRTHKTNQVWISNVWILFCVFHLRNESPGLDGISLNTGRICVNLSRQWEVSMPMVAEIAGIRVPKVPKRPLVTWISVGVAAVLLWLGRRYLPDYDALNDAGRQGWNRLPRSVIRNSNWPLFLCPTCV
jgi:hypothetical protein